MKRIQLGLVALVTLFASASAFTSKPKTVFTYYPTGITTFSGSSTHYLVQTAPINCSGLQNVACKVTTLTQATDPGTGLQVPKNSTTHTIAKKPSF